MKACSQCRRCQGKFPGSGYVACDDAQKEYLNYIARLVATLAAGLEPDEDLSLLDREAVIAWHTVDYQLHRRYEKLHQERVEQVFNALLVRR